MPKSDFFTIFLLVLVTVVCMTNKIKLAVFFWSALDVQLFCANLVVVGVVVLSAVAHCSLGSAIGL